MYLLAPSTNTTSAAPAATSTFEAALQKIPALQEELGRKELQTLASASSTCKSVVDASYLWKRQLNRSLGANIKQASSLLGASASAHNSLNTCEYKNIVRGLNILDGRTARRFSLTRANADQRASVAQATRFLQTRVPGYLDGISSRNMAHTTVYNDESFLSLAVLATGTTTLILAGMAATVYSAFYGFTNISAKKHEKLHLHRPVLCLSGSETSKMAFLCDPKCSVIEVLMLILSCAAVTYNGFSQLRVAWDARHRTESAAALQQRIAVLRASSSPV